MWNPFDRREWRTLGLGAAGALVSGLAFGAVMQPQLGLDKIGGAQTVAGVAGPRQVYNGPDVGLARYEGRIPDYVIGTDWTKPPAPPIEQAASDPGETVVFTADDEPAPVQATRATWRDEPREPDAYPSDAGGVPYEANLPAPPLPPAETDADADLG